MMSRSCVLAAFAAAIGANALGSKDLTKDNFDNEVFKGNKNFVFVKFQAPW